MFHQRFSTNTLPQWRLAQPFRFLAHNGEINTIAGNRNWALARGAAASARQLLPTSRDLAAAGHRMHGSDSQSLDNMLEVLLVGGMDAAAGHAHADSAGLADASTTSTRTCARSTSTTRLHMEPWDGPAGIVLTDGRYAACTLDRNGLRPARYVITDDRHITIASETGVWDYDARGRGAQGPPRARAR